MNPRVMRPWIILALIFLLGAATGSLLTIGFAPHFTSGPPAAHEMGNRWMTHLTRRLNLTDEQQAKIQPIIVKAESQIELVQHDDLGHISSIIKEANSGISPILNPAQQAELQKMEQERERMFPRHMHGSGHGPDDFHHPGPDDHPPAEPSAPAPTS
jgi:Spy/CpxP family protein refolding chaperone